MPSSLSPATIVQVGDVWDVEGHGEREIEHIHLCLRPQRDVAGETFSTEVGSCEAGLPLVVDLSGGKWAYGAQLNRLVRRDLPEEA